MDGGGDKRKVGTQRQHIVCECVSVSTKRFVKDL